jgi:group I intron endonuclease
MVFDAIAYRATNAVNGSTYIGVTKQGLARRAKQHRYYASRGGGFVFHAAIRKYGFENFTFEQIGSFADDYQLALIFEQEAIAKWKPEYNVSLGGEGRTGPMSEAHKQALSRANKGQGLGRKGPPLSEAHKQRLREVNLGNKNFFGKRHTEEARAKLRAASVGRKPPGRTGHTLSEETREKIRASLKGRASPRKGIKLNNGAAVRAAWLQKGGLSTGAQINARASNFLRLQASLKKSVVCLTDGREFDSSQSAAEFYGLRKPAVAQSIRRGHKTRSGLKFAWKEQP